MDKLFYIRWYRWNICKYTLYTCVSQSLVNSLQVPCTNFCACFYPVSCLLSPWVLHTSHLNRSRYGHALTKHCQWQGSPWKHAFIPLHTLNYPAHSLDSTRNLCGHKCVFRSYIFLHLSGRLICPSKLLILKICFRKTKCSVYSALVDFA